MKILVCGGREYFNPDMVKEVLSAYDNPEIIEGGARGADELAGLYADARGWKRTTVKADWAKYGNSAGVIRNRVMLALDPDLVIAFPGGRGTAHMVSIAKTKGTHVIEVKDP